MRSLGIAIRSSYPFLLPVYTFRKGLWLDMVTKQTQCDGSATLDSCIDFAIHLDSILWKHHWKITLNHPLWKDKCLRSLVFPNLCSWKVSIFLRLRNSGGTNGGVCLYCGKPAISMIYRTSDTRMCTEVTPDASENFNNLHIEKLGITIMTISLTLQIQAFCERPVGFETIIITQSFLSVSATHQDKIQCFVLWDTWYPVI